MKKSNRRSLLAASIAAYLTLNAVSISFAQAQSCEEIQSAQARANGEFHEVAVYNGSKGISQNIVGIVEPSVVKVFAGSSTCTGTLLPGNRVLTAGHCFQSASVSPGDYVEFNFQENIDGTMATSQTVAVTTMLEYKNGGLDYAIIEIADDAKDLYPVGRLRDGIPAVNDIMTIIGHSGGQTKSVESGPYSFLTNGDTWINMLDMFAEGGASGGGVVDTDGYTVTMQLGTLCVPQGFSGGGHTMATLRSQSPIIDNLLLSYKVEDRLSYTNDFSDAIEWSNTGDFDWYINTGGTPSDWTGPTSGDYVYFETSDGFANTNNDQAALVSHPFDGRSKAVSFSYHLYGADIGELALEYLNNDIWTSLWTIAGQQQATQTAAWETSTVDIPIIVGQPVTRVRFKATAVGGWQGDIAIDNVKIHPQWKETPELLSDFAYIRSAAPDNNGADLNNQTGTLQAFQSEHFWHSAQWSFKLIDTQYYKITNRWHPTKSIHLGDNPPPAVDFGVAPDTWWSAHWSLEPVAGKADTYRLKNRWRTGYYLYLDGSTLGSSNTDTNTDKFEWKFGKTF